MARAANFDLATELGKPSFTPSQRDAPALVELVVAGEDPTAERAATALTVLGDGGRRAIADRLAGDDRHPDEDATELGDGATARLVSALGLFARRGDAEARAALLSRMHDRVARVRRAAIVALGKLEGDDARTALVARWDAGDVTPDERRALAEALGKIGGDEALARLRALDPGDDAELARRRDRALLIADRSAKRGEDSRVAIDVDPPAPLVVRLRCKPGLGSLLVEDLAARGFAPTPHGDAAADVTLARAWSALFASRLWERAAIRVPLRSDEPRAIVETLTAPRIRALLQAWTVGPIRWRLGFAQGHKRAIVWQVAKDVTARAPELVNDPTQTTWDIAVTDDALEVSPRRLDDPRFAWRIADIPAASHPTVAAAIAYVGEARHGDRVWDPFVGSAAELIERTRLGTYASLLGSDLDDNALAAARNNLAAANVDAKLVNADARTYDPGDIDLIVTNPPLGSRVQVDAAALLVACLPNFARALAPGGRLVWITPAQKKTTKVAEQLGLRRTRSLAVDLGGVRGHLERWER
ncbi:MAG TPA: methyltransferase [Kofleriaceae bacterium]|nr:methyltransferase [Kofleriaceae bacterium]